MKKVFVFGAGASNVSAKTPLGNELVWNYYPDCQLLYKIKDDGKPDLTEVNEEYANYTKFLDLAGEIYPEFRGLKEKWEEKCKEGMWVPPYIIDKRYYVDEMVRILREKENVVGVELVRQLVLEHITEKGLRSGNLLYNNFVKNLIQTSNPEDISIISLNFDCFLETNFVKNYSDYFDYVIDFDMIPNNTTYKKNGIRLLKLNGSLNWGICYKCGKTILVSRQIRKNNYENLYCEMSKKCGGKIYPLIFLPHEGKEKFMNKLSNISKEILQQADKITVIGYSLPYYDKDIINLFKEFTNSKAAVEIVDYEENDEKRRRKEEDILGIVKKIFRGNQNIEIFLDGFQGYMNQ